MKARSVIPQLSRSAYVAEYMPLCSLPKPTPPPQGRSRSSHHFETHWLVVGYFHIPLPLDLLLFWTDHLHRGRRGQTLTVREYLIRYSKNHGCELPYLAQSTSSLSIVDLNNTESASFDGPQSGTGIREIGARRCDPPNGEKACGRDGKGFG